MKKLETHITIDAPPRVVWDVLTDLDQYAEWNPFVVEAQGNVTPGSRLQVRLQSPGGKASKFRPTVTTVEPERTFEWLGHLAFRGIFDGRHRFELEPSGSGTRFVQSEEFRGILVPLLSRTLDSKTRQGFEAMNAAIKDRSEAVMRNGG